MSLYVSQKKSMFDEEIDILATGLDPERFYTLHLSLTHKNGIHEAYATFKPDQNGKIDLSTMAPISGTYSEAHKMGLFISMIASKTNRPAALVVLDPVDPPKIYNLELKDSGDKVLDKVILERYILHPDVERIEIETPEMTATLFRPKGQGPFPALIDMFGSSGGIKEHRAALFASHGFVTLCLPFFNYKNLPSTLADVNMEYFEYAIEFLCNLPYTTNNCGIIGRSFGSCLAMLCAQRYHKITCVINVNGSPSLEEFTTFKENGKLLPYFVPQNGYGIEHEEVVCEIDGKMAIAHNSFYKKVPENHWRLGPVENIPKNTGIYYIATLDDLGINSTETADYFYKRLKKSGHNNIVVDVKPGGHLIDAPYVPHMDFVWNKYFGIYMAYGGEPVSHCKAQEEYWPKILSFLSKNVREPPKMRKLFEIFCEKCHI